jgi:alginate O-acetyltransferase complex protein AlgI
MLFNSLEFALFFPIVTVLYCALPHRRRGAMLLCARCCFYMKFIPKDILILFVTVVIDFAPVLLIHGSGGRQHDLSDGWRWCSASRWC